MKRWLVFLFLLAFVSASVDVDGYDVRSEYVFFDEIEGEVNLSIVDEKYDEGIVLSDGSEVLLGDFLMDNGVDFECFPSDCSMSYEAFSGVTDKSISLLLLENGYVGFVLEGGNVVLDSMSFNIASDFGEEVMRPLVIEFFEDWVWGFGEFSDEFLVKNWGCFNSVNKELGPLIGSSFYCEIISLGDSSVLKVGADVIGGGDELNMVVYPGSGFGASWECSFNPDTEEGCVISPDIGEIFSEGEYQVCVGADTLTEYRIYEDYTGESCGFAYDVGPESSVKDYGVFAQGVMYADAEAMETIDFDEESVDAANYIISDRYDGDCSEGCVLPMRVFGVAQNFRIYNVSLIYTDNSEWESSNLVYELVESSAMVDFPPRDDPAGPNGILDLGFLGLVVSEAGEYFAELSGEDIFRENVRLLPAPIISSVLPLDPPAGVPVLFYAKIDFSPSASSRHDPVGPDDPAGSNENESLSYEWDFGDGTGIVRSNVPYIVYSYNNLENYTLSLRVSAGGNLSSEKSFEVEVISPEEAVETGLREKGISLERVRDIIESFPKWYGDDLLSILEIARFEDELSRLGRAWNNSFDVEDFRDVAQELYALNIPVVVGANSLESPFLMSELGDVDIEPITIISGGVSGALNEDYVKPILTWQNDNVDIVVKSKDVFVSYLNGEDREVLSVHSFDVTSRGDGESYFVINKPFDELYFNDVAGARKVGDATVIILNAGERKSFEFYYEDGDRGSFFISPRLSSLVIEADIESDCNFNEICEEAAGENPDNCRSDCKPTGKAVFFLILSVLFFLVIYSGLQLWYKKHYESYLFKDAAQLYNLLMYVSNARARGLRDNRIGAELRSKGWSSERVNYIIRKSIGKSIGMIEIIPIERVSALIRNWKARKALERAKEIATRVQGQNERKVGKYEARRVD